MSLYHSHAHHFKPCQELRFSINGALLMTAKARYDDLQSFIEQFGAPLSSLPASGLYCFSDPMHHELRILVQCVPEPWCGRCAQSLDDCGCPF